MKILNDITNSSLIDRFALLIGNGPNLRAKLFPDWKKLVAKSSDNGIKFKTVGLSNTEVYDLVELSSQDFRNVKAKVVNQLALNGKEDLSLHREIMQYAIARKSPILTTNFDKAFEKSIDLELFRIDFHNKGSKGFTHIFPWKSYYGLNQISSPLDDFGIWKIHGDIRYKASIRLGLTDYIGAAERARNLIHKGPAALFRGKNQPSWAGRETWLHIWFNMPLIIFGFKYNSDEVFLRWLLIERKRYYKMKNRPMDVWYIFTDELDHSVENLLKNLDVTLVKVSSYDALYDFELK